MFPDIKVSHEIRTRLMSELYPNRIPVGIVVNHLSFGGNSRSAVNLAKSLDSKVFNYLGIAFLSSLNNPLVVEEALLLGSVQLYRPDIWNFASNKIVVYRGCFSPNKCENSISVFVSNSSSDYIRRLSAAVAPLVDRWVAVSPAASAILPKPEATTVIINGVDLDRCNTILGRQEIRNRWKVSDDDVVIGYVGRVVDDGCKIVDVVANAANVLGDRYIPVFVGPAEEKEVNYIRSICPRARFVEKCAQVGDILSAVDCFVLVSRCEGCSLALLEAWAAGIPTVATPVGGVPYFESKYGKFSVTIRPTRDGKTLATAILEATSESNKANILRAREVIRANYNMDEVGRRWAEYLQAVYNGTLPPDVPFTATETPVSIVVPVYNTKPKYLEECYQSISSQTWPSWELILVDDGSSNESTKNKLHDIAKSDSRVRLIVLPDHRGASAARNVGLKEAKHELVACFDSDDIAYPTWLARMVSAMKSNPDIDICGCQLEAFDDDTGRILHVTNHASTPIPSYYELAKYVLWNRPWFINNPGVMYRKKSITSLGGYDERLSCCIDLDLWLRAYMSGRKLYNIPDVLVRYRIHKDQITKLAAHPHTGRSIGLRVLKQLVNKNCLVSHRFLTPESKTHEADSRLRNI